MCVSICDVCPSRAVCRKLNGKEINIQQHVVFFGILVFANTDGILNIENIKYTKSY